MSIAILFLFFFVGDDAPKPAEQLKTLIAESETLEKTHRQELKDDRTAEGVRKANNKYDAACMEWHKEALDIVRKNADHREHSNSSR